MSADNPYHSINENLVSLNVAHKEFDVELNKNCYYPGCVMVSILINALCYPHDLIYLLIYAENVLWEYDILDQLTYTTKLNFIFSVPL